MSQNRKTNTLDMWRIVYRRFPITDKPTIENECYMFYENGTYECYELFRNKAKITTYKSLKWHLLVLWYLNPDMDQTKFNEVAEFITHKQNGFVSFNISSALLDKIVYEVSMLDLDQPPKNKLRKVIFKPFSGLTKEQKLSIVGQLVGQSPRIQSDDIYSVMVDIHDNKQKITIARLAKLLSVSSRTVHRHMCIDLKREKELLNQQL